jgi:hypothetical protein
MVPRSSNRDCVGRNRCEFTISRPKQRHRSGLVSVRGCFDVTEFHWSANPCTGIGFESRRLPNVR